MISVVIPLYNKEKQIRKTLETVLSQTFQNFEIVIVNDGSTDRSVEEVLKIKDERIHLFHQANAGVSAARNRGIEEAKGEYIAFLDADDEWKKDYLQSQNELLTKYPMCQVFACNYELKGCNSLRPTVLKKLSFKEDDGILTNYFEVACNSDSPIWTSAVMVNKKALICTGGFPIGIKSGEDLLTWAKLSIKYQIAFNRKPKAYYCIDYSPSRMPSDIDTVGSEMKIMLAKYHPKHMKKYISKWYKNRSFMYMNFNMRMRSIKEAIRALYYNPFNFKLYIYIFMNLLPHKFRSLIINRSRKKRK